MAKKITKEGIKNWFRNNWAYVVAGEAVIATIVLAVLSGKTNDSGVIDPYVIDRAKDDWMDEFNSQLRLTSTGKYLTIREALACAYLDNYIRMNLKDRGILTDNLECDICDKYWTEFPESAAVLDKIEGFWIYSEDNPVKDQAS